MKQSRLVLLLMLLFAHCADICISSETFVCRSNDFKDNVGTVKDDDDGQCVKYVRYETEISYEGCNGEAWTCYSDALQAGYAVGLLPRVGSIIVFNRVLGGNLEVGHVGIVIAINGSKITIRDSNWIGVNIVGEHVIDVNDYDILGYIYCNEEVKYNFTFPLGSSEGMKPNWSMIEKPLIGVDEWRVQVSNDDPGVDSPEYPSGLVAKSIVIEFSAKVISGGNPVSEGKVYIKDETGSWINSVPLTLINSEFNYNGGQFALNVQVMPSYIQNK